MAKRGKGNSKLTDGKIARSRALGIDSPFWLRQAEQLIEAAKLNVPPVYGCTGTGKSSSAIPNLLLDASPIAIDIKGELAAESARRLA